jgi:glycosyltransferase involved in cell wall biosynthesis
MNNNPLVSIVVPIYNVEKYLSRCLDSICSQTYTNTEIILVNDGSTDKCPEIIQSYAIRENRIKVVNKPNGGPTSARNAGVSIATGKYIWFIDSDDYANLDALGKMIEVACQNNSDIVISGYKLIPNIEKPNDSIYVGPQFNKNITGTEALLLMLCHKIGSDPWARIFKRSLYVENDIVLPAEIWAGEDTLLNYQMFLYAKKISPVEKAAINHIYRKGSLTTLKERFFINQHLGVRYMANYGFPNEDIKNAYYGRLGSDFLTCYRKMNKMVLDKIGIKSVKEINYYLNCLSCYNKVKMEGVKLSFKRKYIFGMFGITPVRFFTAYFMKCLSLFFKKQ